MTSLGLFVMALIERAARLASNLRQKRIGTTPRSCKHDKTIAKFINTFFGCKGFKQNLYSVSEAVVCTKCGRVFDRDLPP